VWWVGIAAVVIAGGVLLWRSPAPQKTAAAPAAVPVTVAAAEHRDVPILLPSLGTVQASNTVSIHSQIDGKLQTINFVEGQQVHKGDTLAEIDPRSLQAALDQAVAKKAQDQAQLVAAQKDLARFQALAAKSFETQQNLDQQVAKVDQLRATVDADQGAIEAAQTQLSYTKITAPIDGRVGFRQLDVGNVIHAGDPNPLTVLTQIQPSVATFTLPQKNLLDVRDAMQRGPVPVRAFDQDNLRELAQGQLLLIDNQIDQTTNTIRLKASFDNKDDRLWPGEFVRVSVQVDTKKDAVTIPPVALQRGVQGFYTWVIKPDSTAEQRTVEATPVNDDIVIVSKGLEAGERVVINGQYRVQPGAKVDAKTEADSQTAKVADNPS
jgi:multidrug efflux system membrane fusion protein